MKNLHQAVTFGTNDRELLKDHIIQAGAALASYEKFKTKG